MTGGSGVGSGVGVGVAVADESMIGTMDGVGAAVGSALADVLDGVPPHPAILSTTAELSINDRIFDLCMIAILLWKY